MTLAEKWTATQDFFRTHVAAQEIKDEKLAKAVAKNDATEAARWLKAGADASPRSSYNDRNALLVAIDDGNKDMLKLLIDGGANPNNVTDYGSTTPFLRAIEKGNLEIVTMLIDAKANIDTAGYRGLSPLSSAISSGNKALADLLLDRGADVNAQTRGSWSPIFYAARKGDLEMVEKLLAKGARTDRRDDEGRTVLGVAKACEQTAVYNKIQAHIDAQVKPWQPLADDKIAHVSIMRDLGYKLTEVFNLKTQQYTAITHNYSTNADSSVTRVLDATADKNLLAEAETQLKTLRPAPKPQTQPGA